MANTQQSRPSQTSLPGTHPSPEPVGGMIQQLIENESAFRTFLHRRVGDEALVEDLLQQSFIKAVEHQHSLQLEDSAVAWFYRVLRNTLIDYYRVRGSEARRHDAFLQELMVSGSYQEPPLDEVKTAACLCLHRLLPSLHSDYAELLRRIDLEDESPGTIAEELKVTPNNLRVRLHRARQALRTGLEKSCGVCSQHGCLNCSCD